MKTLLCAVTVLVTLGCASPPRHVWVPYEPAAGVPPPPARERADLSTVLEDFGPPQDFVLYQRRPVPR